jgi:hypothetical protein
MAALLRQEMSDSLYQDTRKGKALVLLRNKLNSMLG